MRQPDREPQPARATPRPAHVAPAAERTLTRGKRNSPPTAVVLTRRHLEWATGYVPARASAGQSTSTHSAARGVVCPRLSCRNGRRCEGLSRQPTRLRPIDIRKPYVAAPRPPLRSSSQRVCTRARQRVGVRPIVRPRDRRRNVGDGVPRGRRVQGA